MFGLRALLIRKDAKHYAKTLDIPMCLRALLIQKDAKRKINNHSNNNV